MTDFIHSHQSFEVLKTIWEIILCSTNKKYEKYIVWELLGKDWICVLFNLFEHVFSISWSIYSSECSWKDWRLYDWKTESSFCLYFSTENQQIQLYATAHLNIVDNIIYVLPVNVELVKIRTIFELTGGNDSNEPQNIKSTVLSSIMKFI